MLRLISDAPDPIGVNELSRKIGLHKSSISRIVSTLHHANFLRRDETTGKFSVGMGLLALAAPLQNRLSLNDIVKPIITEMARVCDETCSFNVWDGACGVSLINIAGGSTIRVFSPPGKRKPGHATATGKILLAYQPAALAEAFCNAPQPRFTEATITDPTRLREELDEARSRGYATNFGEFEKDVGAVAVAVLSPGGEAIGCVSLTVPIFRLSRERSHELGVKLVECGRTIARNLLLAPDLPLRGA